MPPTGHYRTAKRGPCTVPLIGSTPKFSDRFVKHLFNFPGDTGLSKRGYGPSESNLAPLRSMRLRRIRVPTLPRLSRPLSRNTHSATDGSPPTPIFLVAFAPVDQVIDDLLSSLQITDGGFQLIKRSALPEPSLTKRRKLLEDESVLRSRAFGIDRHHKQPFLFSGDPRRISTSVSFELAAANTHMLKKRLLGLTTETPHL